jgi:hypothetical protein
MTSQVVAAQSFSFASDHLEQLTRGVSALTVDPFKNALYYFFPFLGAFFANYQRIQDTPDLQAMMPSEPTNLILKEIKDLTDCAQISQEVVPYMALNHQFSSCGGSYSLTRPALLIPEQYLFRRGDHCTFGNEKKSGQDLRKQDWIFSDDETRFFIARELGQIKENSALLRIAIKVAVLAVFLTIYASPFGWPLGLALFIGTLGLYIVSERVFQARADIIATEILGKKVTNPVQIAIDALEKLRQQNLYRRENSKLARVYLTEKGDNGLDFTHEYLTTRIERLREWLKKSSPVYPLSSQLPIY